MINKFIKHYHRKDKTPYVAVNVKFLNGKKNDLLTVPAQDYLGKSYTSKVRDFKFSKFSIDK